MVLSQACRPLSHDLLYTLNGRHRCAVLDREIRDVISRLRLRRRGCRGGDHHRRKDLAAQAVTSSVDSADPARETSAVIGYSSPNVNINQLYCGHCDVHDTADETVQ